MANPPLTFLADLATHHYARARNVARLLPYLSNRTTKGF